MYDIILEISQAIVKNGLNLSALGTVLFILLKRRRVKKVISRYFPWLAMEPEDVANYEARQIRIEQDVRAIKEHLGVKGWDAHYLNGKTAHNVTDGQRNNLLKRSVAYVRAHFIGESIRMTKDSYHSKTKGENTQMKSKLLSRKFLMALISAALVIANDGLNLGLDQNTIIAFGSIVVGWIVAEATTDIAKKSPEVSLYDAKSLDSVRSDSEDVGHTASN